MNRAKLQMEVTEWLADLPEADYTSSLVVARFNANNENGNGNYVGYTGPKKEYMQCIGALAENGVKHGYLAKTLPINPSEETP